MCYICHTENIVRPVRCPVCDVIYCRDCISETFFDQMEWGRHAHCPNCRRDMKGFDKYFTELMPGRIWPYKKRMAS